MAKNPLLIRPYFVGETYPSISMKKKSPKPQGGVVYLGSKCCCGALERSRDQLFEHRKARCWYMVHEDCAVLGESGWMYGWMDGRTDGWMDGWMDEWIGWDWIRLDWMGLDWIGLDGWMDGGMVLNVKPDIHI